MDKDQIELYKSIGEIAAALAFVYGGFRLGWEKVKKKLKLKQRTKQLEQNKIHSISSLYNIEEMHNTIVSISQDYSFAYSHLLLFHNSGKDLDELSQGKMTIRMEHPLYKVIPRMKEYWQGREIDYEWIPILRSLNQKGAVHYIDADKVFDDDTGVKFVYNTKYGKEFLFCHIGWVGCNYVVLGLQREAGKPALTNKQKNYIKYRARKMIKLLENAKYFIRQNEKDD